jgi:hypothetical protein
LDAKSLTSLLQKYVCIGDYESLLQENSKLQADLVTREMAIDDAKRRFKDYFRQQEDEMNGMKLNIKKMEIYQKEMTALVGLKDSEIDKVRAEKELYIMEKNQLQQKINLIEGELNERNSQNRVPTFNFGTSFRDGTIDPQSEISATVRQGTTGPNDRSPEFGLAQHDSDQKDTTGPTPEKDRHGMEIEPISPDANTEIAVRDSEKNLDSTQRYSKLKQDQSIL